jgi:hypothetical protein
MSHSPSIRIEDDTVYSTKSVTALSISASGHQGESSALSLSRILSRKVL